MGHRHIDEKKYTFTSKRETFFAQKLAQKLRQSPTIPLLIEHFIGPFVGCGLSH